MGVRREDLSSERTDSDHARKWEDTRKGKHPLLESSAVLLPLTLANQDYGGSFANFIRELQQEKPKLTALDVVLKVVEVFPSFRDITTYEGREGW